MERLTDTQKALGNAALDQIEAQAAELAQLMPQPKEGYEQWIRNQHASAVAKVNLDDPQDEASHFAAVYVFALAAYQRACKTFLLNLEEESQ